MGEIFDHRPDLDAHAETVVICHHGARSAYVTRILNRSSFESIYNLEGGLDAYSFVDASVPRYLAPADAPLDKIFGGVC